MTIDEFIRLMNSGGNIALCGLAWIAYKSIILAHDAVNTLKSMQAELSVIRVNMAQLDRDVADLPDRINGGMR